MKYKSKKRRNLLTLLTKRYESSICDRNQLLTAVKFVYSSNEEEDYYREDLNEAAKYLIDTFKRYKPYLPTYRECKKFLLILAEQEDNDNDPSLSNEEILDNLMDAVLLFISVSEKKEIDSIPIELRLTDPREWVRNYKSYDYSFLLKKTDNRIWTKSA